MLHRKLLEVLVRLNGTEQKQLRLFLESPYFVQGQNTNLILPLYDLIIRNGADEMSPNLEKSAVFSHLFPDKVFLSKEKSPLDSLSSELFRLVRVFLSQQYFENKKSKVTDSVALMTFYRKSGLEERFWQIVESTRKTQNEIENRGADYFYNQFVIEEEISNFLGIYNTYEDDANLKNANLFLDSFFSILKLEQACALTHRSRISQIVDLPPNTLTEAVLLLANNEAYLKSPLITIYKKILSFIESTPSPDDLEEFKRLIDKEKLTIPPEKYRDIQSYFRSFWIRQSLRSGNPNDRLVIFELYNDHLYKGYLYIDDKLTPMALRVLTNAGLKVGQFPWVKKLLDDHPPERICGTKYPVEAHSLNVAEYHFHKKEYAEAEAKLTYRAFENPNFSIMADLLLIKIYYETNSELLESRMKALEQKVRRSKISTETKAGYYNFLKKLDKVVKYGWQKSTPKLAKLVEEIKTTPGVIDREWLLSKLS